MELLVAVTTFTVVMAGVYAAFTDAARFWRECENDVDVFHQARVTLSILERELRNTHEAAGFLFLGENKGAKGRHRDEITFYTVSVPLAGDQQQMPELMKVKYYLSGPRQGLGRQLWRREWRVRGPLPRKQDFARRDEPPDDKFVKFHSSMGDRVVLAEHVESLEFVYYWPRPENQTPWFEECRRGVGPPAMIRIEMIITDTNLPSGKKKFSTLVVLPYTPGPGPKSELWLDEQNVARS